MTFFNLYINTCKFAIKDKWRHNCYSDGENFMLFHDLCIIVFVLYQVFDVPFIISLFHVQNVHGIYLYLYLYICLWDISISINIYLSSVHCPWDISISISIYMSMDISVKMLNVLQLNISNIDVSSFIDQIRSN